MSEWKEYRFSDFVEINPTVSLPTNESISFVEMKDLNESQRYCYSSSERSTRSGSKFKNHDTLFARITPCLENGKICQVKGLKNNVGLGSTEFFVFRGKEGISDSDFVFYLSRTDDVRSHAVINLDGTSGRQRVPKACFDDLIINVPSSIAEQKSIASVLSSLDDKIDLLHRQNDTLENMAETLFRQWFVEEEKEEWEEGTLDDILTVKGGTTPSTKEPAYWNGSIHWTSPRDITNLNGIYLFDTERKITELGLSKISSGLLPKGTLLMSSRAPVGVLAFCEIPVAINQGYIAILDNKGYSKEFIYLWLKANIDVVHSFSNGSTFMEISKSAFKTLQLQIPPKQVLTDFQLIVKPLFQKIKSNQTQIQTLTALRDTLLPKLMSGEVRVSGN